MEKKALRLLHVFALMGTPFCARLFYLKMPFLSLLSDVCAEMSFVVNANLMKSFVELSNKV